MAKSNHLVDESELRNLDPNLVAGPGADPEKGAAPVPLLEGASEYEYIDLLNPLSVEFIGMFGVSRPQQGAPVSLTTVQGRGVTKNESDLRNNYGLDLRNPDHVGRANIVNRVSIKSGQTIRLLGSEAQVVARQLVNEIMQREGNRLLMADGHARREVEERIIISRGNVADALGRTPTSVAEQLQAVKEEVDEPEFPTLSNPRTGADFAEGSDKPSDSDSGQPRSNSGNAKAQAK